MAAKALPADLRERLLKLTSKHDSTYGSSGRIRPGMTPPASPIEAIGQVHPILRKVPTTGEEAIFSVAASTTTSSACRSKKVKRFLTNYGRIRANPNSVTITNGKSAKSSPGTIA